MYEKERKKGRKKGASCERQKKEAKLWTVANEQTVKKRKSYLSRPDEHGAIKIN